MPEPGFEPRYPRTAVEHLPAAPRLFVRIWHPFLEVTQYVCALVFICEVQTFLNVPTNKIIAFSVRKQAVKRGAEWYLVSKFQEGSSVYVSFISNV